MTFYQECEFQDTTIGKIPKEWTITELSAIGKVSTGKTPATANTTYWEGNIPFITPADMDETKYVYRTKRKITQKAATCTKVLPKNAVIVVCIGSTIGKVALTSQESVTNQQINSVIPNNINPEFLYYSILFRASQLKAMSGVAAVPIVKKSLFEQLKVALPTSLEQNEVARVLSTVDSALELADKVIAKTERLKKGLMQQLLTHGIGHTEYKDTPIGKIPKTWKVTTINEECLVGTGGTPSRNIAKYFGGAVPWAKSTEVDYCVITKTEETLTEEGVQNSNAKVYPAGSLVIALYGQGRTRGKCAILGIDAAINQACAVIQSKERIHIPYLFYWFQNSYSAIRGMSQGANQANLNMGIIRSLEIPLPATSEQKKITEVLSAIDAKLKIEKSEKTKMERIKQGLMDLLLTGKVRIKEAN